MKVMPLNGPAGDALGERFRRGDPDTCALFGSHPSRSDDWRRRAARLDETAAMRADRTRLVSALKTACARHSFGAAAEPALRKLERPDCLVVVGGQQAGLFGGPLLVFYKALAVIRAAARAERMLGRPVVPVFWIAGEDHDFAEANETHVLAPDGAVRQIRLEGVAGGRHAVSRTPVPAAAWENALDRLAHALPDSEHKPSLLAGLRETVADAPTLTVAFARLLDAWLGGEGLLVMDADDPEIRRLEGSFFRELVERNDELAEALAEGERRVRALGYHPQAETPPDGAHLFVHHDMGRLLLYRRGGSFSDRRGFFRAERAELASMAEKEPERFSTGALSRPLMQDFLLPVLATVLGPAEIAYWGQLGPAFSRFGIGMPVIVPRPSFTFLEPWTESLLQQLGLAPEEAIWRWEERRAAWLEAREEKGWDERFRAVREGVAALYEPLLKALAEAERGLGDLGRKNLDRIMEQIAYLEQKTREASLRRHDASLRRWDRVRAALCPMGRPQERVLGTIHFLNGYGPSWIGAWSGTELAAETGRFLARYEAAVREACQLGSSEK
jgi:bacillithiol biosynthesis cysteine-adding enzyme BshC